MTRLQITHRTRYDYGAAVTVSYNEARMTPQTDPEQTVLEAGLQVHPAGAAPSRHRDYWGTVVHTFDIHQPHSSLEVIATATVEISRDAQGTGRDQPGTAEMIGEAGVGWEQLADEQTLQRFSDYLPQSQLSGPGDELSGVVEGLAGGSAPAQAVQEVFAWLREEMEYQPGTTEVHDSAETAFAARRGVCQDLSHVAIGALRHLGIPTRYVSGYIHPDPQAVIGQEVAGESHAWLEWWDGRWRSWDPTNHQPAGNLHIRVAHGRDYADVTPFKGILSGGGGQTVLQVEVSVVRLS